MADDTINTTETLYGQPAPPRILTVKELDPEDQSKVLLPGM